MSSLRAQEFLSKWLCDWSFFSISASGSVDGLTSAFKPSISVIYSKPSSSFINTSILNPLSGGSLSLYNVYGPCHEKRPFWTNIFNSELNSSDIKIMGGDLNFTLSLEEIWVFSARPDPLAPLLNSFCDRLGLFNVHPAKLEPTWRNNRNFQDSIAKGLDHFIISEALLNSHF